MPLTNFQFTPEQTNLLLNMEDHITAAVPTMNKSFVIIPQDTFEKMRELLQVDEVDPSFFDCEEIDPASTS